MRTVCLALTYVVCCAAISFNAILANSHEFRDYALFRITKLTVDTVSLTHASTVSIEVVSSYRPSIRNVTARIVPGEGYRIVSQPDAKADSLPREKTFAFTGVIQATSQGMWYVPVECEGISRKGTKMPCKDGIYIFLSDTLNRALTTYERQVLVPRKGKLPPQPSRDSITILPSLPAGGRAKPHIPDSLLQKGQGRGRRSGTFDITGYLLYHDARDPQGWFKPAVNCDVEVWNDNEYDNPSKADTWLGTTITGWDGCFSLYGLDNSDGDGTADPYLIYKTENDTWVVAPSLGGNPYDWFSSIVRDVSNYSMVNFGSTYIFGGDPYDEGAMWCFQYMNLGWNTAWSAGTSPSFVPCVWRANQSYSAQLNGNIFIIAPDADAIDVVNHEYSHALMYQGYNGSIPLDCQPTYINDSSCLTDAWTEGWAFFFPLVVTPDGVYNLHPNGDHIHLEYPLDNDNLDFATGPAVAGRVAGALLDLWDSNNDGLDQNSPAPVSFSTIYTWGIQSHRDSTFHEFWNYLRNNELTSTQIDLGLASILNNTIDFCCTSCGDADGNHVINISDVVAIIGFVFNATPVPGDCNYQYGLGDADGNGIVNASDIVAEIAFVFNSTPVPHCQGTRPSITTPSIKPSNSDLSSF